MKNVSLLENGLDLAATFDFPVPTQESCPQTSSIDIHLPRHKMMASWQRTATKPVLTRTTWFQRILRERQISKRKDEEPDMSAKEPSAKKAAKKTAAKKVVKKATRKKGTSGTGPRIKK